MSAPAVSRALPDPQLEPTIKVERGAAVLDVSLRAGYAAVERGEWPSIRVGRRIVLPTQRWLAAVGLADD